MSRVNTSQADRRTAEARREAAERARKEAAKKAAAEARRKEAAKAAEAAKLEHAPRVERTVYDATKKQAKVEMSGKGAEKPKSAGELQAYAIAADEVKKAAKAGGQRLTAGEARQAVDANFGAWVEKAGKSIDQGASLDTIRKSFSAAAGGPSRAPTGLDGPMGAMGGPTAAAGGPTPAAKAQMPWEVGLENGKIPADRMEPIGVGNHRLWGPAADAFKELMAAAARDGVNITVTDSYRDYAGQVACKEKWTRLGKPQNAATPGTSKHGWGLAVDLGSSDWNKAFAWLKEHGAEYGFQTITSGGAGSDEAWHWQYGGGGAPSTPSSAPSSTSGGGTSGGGGSTSGGSSSGGTSSASGPSGGGGGGGSSSASGPSSVSGSNPSGSTAPPAAAEPPFDSGAIDRSLASDAGIDWDEFFAMLTSYYDQEKEKLTESNPEFRKWLQKEGWKPGQPITKEMKAQFLAEKLSGAAAAAGGGEDGLAKAAKSLEIPEPAASTSAGPV